MPTPPVPEEVKQQRLNAIREHGSVDAAAPHLGMSASGLRSFLRDNNIPAREAKGDPALRITGRSTLYGPDGEMKAEWVKTASDKQAQREDAIRQAIEACEALPRMEPVKAPKVKADHLCNVYTLTDCHIGMLSWPKETGEAWDLDIAGHVLTGCFAEMIRNAPDASTCVIAQMGDWLHYDSLVPETPTNRNILDADGRFAKMVEVAIRVLRRICDLALKKHKRVIVLLAEGNHDLASSVWLRCMFKALYERERRLSVIDSEFPYYAHRHGETMLFWHHGHLKRPEGIYEIVAGEFASMWGATTKRYAHLGDKHHWKGQERNGLVIEQHPTLAARDSYASRHGWQSQRRAAGITYHEKHGEVARTIVTPEMIE